LRQINNFIEENYSIAATDIRLLDSHFGTEIYKAYTDKGDFIVKAMPYVLYFWHTMCNYAPGEMLNIPDTYAPIAILIRKLLARLYDNVDKLSQTL